MPTCAFGGCQREPILCPDRKVVDCNLVRSRDRLVFQVKTAAVKVERDGLGELFCPDFLAVSCTSFESVISRTSAGREADVHVLDSVFSLAKPVVT